MAGSFYFFDLETSGFSPRNDRIMQFGGQRTDMELNPIGEPDNILVKMTPDILPEPGAVLVHGITPQKTISEGISEVEFCKYLTSKVSTADTIMVGYNNVRFDNEFIRFTLWRNFHDAYEWSWKEGCSTWDLLDLVRMTRALRPEGIKWPFAPDGTPSNKLEYLSAVNKLDHSSAHDALSDVQAAMGLAKLIKSKQPKLFIYLLEHRGKDRIRTLVTAAKPVVYSSGRYPAEYNRTAVAVMLCQNNDKSGALMYDLRIDPDEFKDLSAGELANRWKAWGEDVPYFPVKVLRYNHCPAVAPLAVLNVGAGYEKLQLHQKIVKNHLAKLNQAEGFADKLLKALEMVWPPRPVEILADIQKVDAQLYEGFIKSDDKTKLSVIRAAQPDELSGLNIDFKDGRLKLLLSLYKSRNFTKSLSGSEQTEWESFRRAKLLDSGRAETYFKNLEEIARTPGLDPQKKYLLEELNLYAQSVIPVV